MMTLNENDVRKCYRFLAHANTTELRLINPNRKGKPLTFFVGDEETFVERVKDHDDKSWNIYCGIHERQNNGTEGKDVVSVKTIVIDIDPKREKGLPSTEEELNKADDVASSIIYFFIENDYQIPIKIMSGNGIQLWCAIPEIKITDENRIFVESRMQMFQRMIKEKFETVDVSIDNIGDLARIIKVAGTKSIKGKPSDSRPHRYATVMSDSFERHEDVKLQQFILNLKTTTDTVVKRVKPFSLLPIKDIKEESSKFKKIYIGEWESCGFPSRSEAEAWMVTFLLSYGYDYENICEVMSKSKVGKWNEKEESYRRKTFENCQMYFEKNKVPLDSVYKVFDKWMYIPDKNRIDAMLSVALSRKMTGKPLWLIFVGASGDGKSEQVMTMKDDNKTTYILHELTSKTLVSGYEQAQDLAPRLNNKLVIVPDMAQILSLHPQEKGAVWSQLRELYDGRQGKATGTGVDTKYEGLRVTMVLCSTPAIDNQILIHQSLGTRELIWRTEGSKNEHRVNLMRKIRENIGKEEQMEKELRSTVIEFINSHSPKKIDIPDDVVYWIEEYSNFICIMRSAGSTDRFTGELSSFIEPEQPTRILNQLIKFYFCLKSLDNDYSDEKALKILRHLAFSSIDKDRMRVLEAVIFHDEHPSTNAVAKKLKIGYKTAFKELNILFHLGIVNREDYENDYGKISHIWSINYENDTVKFIKRLFNL